MTDSQIDEASLRLIHTMLAEDAEMLHGQGGGMSAAPHTQSPYLGFARTRENEGVGAFTTYAPDTSGLGWDAGLGKGKQKEQEMSDAELARKLYEKDIWEQLGHGGERSQAPPFDHEAMMAADRRLAIKVASEIPEGCVYEEGFVSFQGLPEPSPPPRAAPLLGPSAAPLSEPRAAPLTAVASSSKSSPQLDCVACSDSFPESSMARCPCGHAYCQECLVGVFEASLSDVSMFPPKCCNQPIGIEEQSDLLAGQQPLLRRMREREAETTGPARLYCHVPRCSAVIPDDLVSGDVGRCPACRAETCKICRGEAHRGDCPDDTATQQLLETAREKRWMRCYSCRRMVELADGCNHMSKYTTPHTHALP